MSESKQTPVSTVVVKDSKRHLSRTAKMHLAIVAIVIIVIVFGALVISRRSVKYANFNTVVAQATQLNQKNKPLPALTLLNAANFHDLSSQQLGQLARLKGQIYQNKGDFAPAVTAYEAALQKDPKNTALFLTIAQLAESGKDYKTAAQYYQKTIDLIKSAPVSQREIGYNDDLANLEAHLQEDKSHE